MKKKNWPHPCISFDWLHLCLGEGGNSSCYLHSRHIFFWELVFRKGYHHTGFTNSSISNYNQLHRLHRHVGPLALQRVCLSAPKGPTKHYSVTIQRCDSCSMIMKRHDCHSVAMQRHDSHSGSAESQYGDGEQVKPQGNSTVQRCNSLYTITAHYLPYHHTVHVMVTGTPGTPGTPWTTLEMAVRWSSGGMFCWDSPMQKQTEAHCFSSHIHTNIRINTQLTKVVCKYDCDLQQVSCNNSGATQVIRYSYYLNREHVRQLVNWQR